MKKNKTIAYALAATLLVGGTFAGTKAWFTSQETANTDLVITTGTVDLEVVDNGWYLDADGTGTEATPVDKSNENFMFRNVKPGDGMWKQFDVTNTGTLNQKIDVKGGKITNEAGPFVIQSSHNGDQIDGVTLAPGETAGFMIFVDVPLDWEGQDMKFSLDQYMTDIVIDAEQTAAKPGQENPNK